VQRNVLDVASTVEPVQLDDQLQHCSLNLIVATCTVVESRTTLQTDRQLRQTPVTRDTHERIHLVEKDDARFFTPRHFLSSLISARPGNTHAKLTNSDLTILAPSPTYFCTSSDPMTLINVASVRFATARAQSVFPVPGGPTARGQRDASKIPRERTYHTA
jgi:hypothetical protein